MNKLCELNKIQLFSLKPELNTAYKEAGQESLCTQLITGKASESAAELRAGHATLVSTCVPFLPLFLRQDLKQP